MITSVPDLVKPLSIDDAPHSLLIRSPTSAGSNRRRICERVADLVVHGVVAAVDAVGVDAEQDGDAVAQPPGDLGRRDAGIQPERGRVPQVVGPADQRRGNLRFGQRLLASELSSPVVDRLRRRPTV
ncbi:hypothetical protein [Micromonospora lupini]|uniref:hypothetical protein n=1 Tax=Micromonospora lupini TaxID=285679 RepID=UPI0033CDFD80